MKRAIAVGMAVASLAATPFVPWTELTEADIVYKAATRFATIEARTVHYPTPTVELVHALESMSESMALRHLAEAKASLGDRAGARAALEKWAAAEGPSAWADAARFAYARGDVAFAFSAADSAMRGLPLEEKRTLADERIEWAKAHPADASLLDLQRKRFELSPDDARSAARHVRELIADKAEDALQVLDRLPDTVLSGERRVVLRADALHKKGDRAAALAELDRAMPLRSIAARKAFAARVDGVSPQAPATWRETLDRGFDAAALVRLATYFAGSSRGDAAYALLRQIDRRHGDAFDRAKWLELAALYASIDAVPEAFRARLAAAQGASAPEAADDLVALCELALRAGGRPLAWGTYNEAPYAWAARFDRTPGLLTGGLSMLLTGTDWKEALARIETDSVPSRTFETARALEAELARRARNHPGLDALRVAIMERHVERGEGERALALLAPLEASTPQIAERARRAALLALRQTKAPLAEEVLLFKARLRGLAPDGTRDPFTDVSDSEDEEGVARKSGESYKSLLDEAVSRLEERDPSHRAAIDLMLSEMGRLKDAEVLWLDLAERLEAWNLDDDLRPRYENAVHRFSDASWWSRLARLYARKKLSRELAQLASDLVARFRGAEIFERAAVDADLEMEVADQPRTGARVRLVRFADFVRLAALGRFPHSPAVVRDAVSHLVRRSDWPRVSKRDPRATVVDDGLLDQRRSAVLFVDETAREAFFAEAMKQGSLEERLVTMERLEERTPVHDLILFEGWSRLSRFERAHAAADRLTAAYPGEPDFARRALAVHRSLAGLDSSHVEPARVLVERSATTLADPEALWTELGELYEDAGRGDLAQAAWRRVLDGKERDAGKVEVLASVLWDYGHMKEALAAIEDARARLARPRLMAFEAGVLREETKDLEGALREYLDAASPADTQCFCSAFEEDQRALRRLVQLVGRETPLARILARIEGLQSGRDADERAIAALFPLATVTDTTPGLDWDVDDWIDAMDAPRDPVGREARQAAMEAARGAHGAGLLRVRKALVAKVLSMVPLATDRAFLDTAQRLVDSVAAQALSGEEVVAARSAFLLRRAGLAPTEDDAVRLLADRARLLLDASRVAEAEAAWKSLRPRVAALPEGASRLRAESEHVSFVERAKGADAAALEWERLGNAYPWSLGLLDDRVRFLARTGRTPEALDILEAAATRAASGHREDLLSRLTSDSLGARDLPRARRASLALIGTEALEPDERLGALRLHARLRILEDRRFDVVGFARAEAPRLPAPRRAELFAEAARAAFDEGVDAAATSAWIEALNLRLERAWLKEAFQAAERGGKTKELLSFFETQQKRSPRDVRWAVAVRDLRLLNSDVSGAIEMARFATSVRPERESLWREAADLLVRAGRIREAADVWEGYARPRPADESVASLRSSLHARAGDAEKALAVERDALEAFRRAKPMDDERTQALSERAARAARRLTSAGLPVQAWRLLSPDGGVGKIAASALSSDEQARLALQNDSFLRLLRARSGDDEYRSAAASVLADAGRSEALAEFEAWVLRQLYAAGSAGDVAALRRTWPMVEQSGIEAGVRVAIARRLLANAPGAWRSSSSEAFVESVGAVVVERSDDGWRFGAPDLEALWVADLARRDAASELASYLTPRFLALLADARGAAAPDPSRHAWTRWLDAPSVLEAFARGASKDAVLANDLAAVFSERSKWDRFFKLAASRWDVTPLVALLPEEARSTWFGFWLGTGPRTCGQAGDPEARARCRTVEAAAAVVGRLVRGDAGVLTDPLLAKIRGPRTVGDVLGKDAAWVFQEFLAPGDTGAVETRGVGRGVDAGRLPVALWGERAGVSWYALEALARTRAGERLAGLVALEVPDRGNEALRLTLAARLVERSGDAKRALSLLEGGGVSSRDAQALAFRLRLLAAAGEQAKAATLWRETVVSEQGSMNEARLVALKGIATDLDLASPLTLLDPAKPVGGALLAYIRDVDGERAASALKTDDLAGYRSALLARWAPRQARLDAGDIKTWLDEIWAKSDAPLPVEGLSRLGGVWPHTARLLEKRSVPDRGAALEALRALPEATRLEALVGRAARDEDAQLVLVRAYLLRHDDAAAARVLNEALAVSEGVTELRFEPIRGTPAESGEPWLEIPEEAASSNESASVSRLRAWFAPFKDAGREDLVRASVRDALKRLRAPGSVPADAWRLALEIESPESRATVVEALDDAWIRGELAPTFVPDVVEALADLAPQAVPTWISRWERTATFEDVARRARALRSIGDRAAAAATLAEGQKSVLWSRTDDVRAFDMWRRLGLEADASTPPAWRAAASFWTTPADEVVKALDPHLAAHPYDVLSARAVLRSLAPTPKDGLLRALRALRDPALASIGTPDSDENVVRLRAARGALGASWRAARSALGPVDPRSLARELTLRRFRRQDVAAAIADVARIAARAGDASTVDAALRALSDAHAPGFKELRAEIEGLAKAPAPAAYRSDSGRPAPYLPRDLTFDVLKAVLDAEAKP